MTKQQALLEFLKDQGHEYDLDDLHECTYDESTFDVNPHPIRYGTSPSELVEQAKRVRAALAELFPTVKQEKWDSSRVNKRVYRILDRRLKAKIWAEPQKEHDNEKARAYQDIVNFFYFLTDVGVYDRERRYRAAVRQAFDTGSADEYRELSHTQDFTFLVLTEEEADERARQYAESLIDDCYDLPTPLEPYFDRDRFVDDCVNIDGRGVQLAGYDHEEHEQGEFFIYRTN